MHLVAPLKTSTTAHKQPRSSKRTHPRANSSTLKPTVGATSDTWRARGLRRSMAVVLPLLSRPTTMMLTCAWVCVLAAIRWLRRAGNGAFRVVNLSRWPAPPPPPPSTLAKRARVDEKEGRPHLAPADAKPGEKAVEHAHGGYSPNPAILCVSNCSTGSQSSVSDRRS